MHGKFRGWVAAGVVSLVGWGAPAWAAGPGQGTIFVDDDHQQCPNAQFTSIQAAVLAAPPGGQIHVCAGLYPESVTVDRTLRIDGAGPDPDKRTGDPQSEAVVNPTVTSSRGFDVQASDCVITGFTVFGDGSTTLGIDVSPLTTGNTVERNFVSGHVIGIELSVGGPNRRPSLIAWNRVEQSRFGIAIDDNLGPAPDVDNALLTIRQNNLAKDDTGILLQRMRGVEVKLNAITDFSEGIAVRRSTQISVLQNDLETGGFSHAGISLRNDDSNLVFGNEIRGRFRGPPTAGIELDGSNGDVVTGNRISRMQGDGVLLTGAISNSVVLNRSDDNGADGIHLVASSHNSLFLNFMHGNKVFDAADDQRGANIWEHNHCETDFPPGTICTEH